MLQDLERESQLLYSVARPRVTDAELRALLDNGINFGKLGLLAERERATVPLWQRLASMNDASLPDEASHLQTMAMVSEFRLLHLRQLLVDTLDLLSEKGIEALLLKGAGLAVSVYPRFIDRPMWDLDILVPSDRAQEAWDTMVDQGWQPAPVGAAEGFYGTHHHHLPPLDDPKNVGCVLEIHRELLPGDSPFGFAAADFWPEASSIRFEGHDVRIPRLSHQIIHLSTHFAWSHMMDSAGWRTFRDLAWIVDSGKVDWDEVVEFALRTRSGTCCYWTLRLARTMVHVTIPDAVLTSLKPPGGEWRLARLEKAFALSLFPYSDRRCPSVALFRLLWRMGIRPVWSGHTGNTPWDIVELGGADMGTGMGQRSSVWDQIRRFPQWMRFASAALRSG